MTGAIQLRGIFPPIPTPFEPDGAVAHEHLAANLGRWNETPLSGYVVLGSTGEYVYLTWEERLKVLEVARRHIPASRRLIAGTGWESTQVTIEFTRRAADRGADAALVVTPCYYKAAMKPEVLRAHYERVAGASPIPVILYNVPQFTGVNLPPGLAAELGRHPQITGIKDSTGDVGQVQELVRLAPPGFQVVVGMAETLLASLATGACGAVLAFANIAPHQCVELQRLHDEGKLEEARALQWRMVPSARAVTSTYGIRGLKAAMDLLGYYGGPPRPPLPPATPDEVAAIRGLLRDAGLL
ncbi:MAG: dihydrodipicolinate synthase family protein [Deltaproteobacteria bacterium]|nr:dihydrodipicolinate synthase family protein [Deltaproteobacteria bacterium]